MIFTSTCNKVFNPSNFVASLRYLNFFFVEMLLQVVYFIIHSVTMYVNFCTQVK